MNTVTGRLPPPLLSSSPRPLIAALHQAPDGSVCVCVCVCVGGAETARSGAVICRERLSSGDRFIPRACALVSSWVQVGSVERLLCSQRRELLDPMPTRCRPQDAGPTSPVECRGPRGRRSWTSHRPSRPDLRGERVRSPDSAPYLDPSFQNTALPSQTPQHDEDTRSPVYFGHYFPLWTLYLYYFCWIKGSPRPDATPTVSVVCSSRHNTQRCNWPIRIKNLKQPCNHYQKLSHK